jgi:hypothetical protein
MVNVEKKEIYLLEDKKMDDIQKSKHKGNQCVRSIIIFCLKRVRAFDRKISRLCRILQSNKEY